jgi:hypothetical protein
METLDYNLPAYWAGYFVNGDACDDEADIVSFLNKEGLCVGDFLGIGDDTWFSWHNDSGNGLGGDVCTFTFIEKQQ